MTKKLKKSGEEKSSRNPQQSNDIQKILSCDYESVINSIQELIFIVDTSGKIVGFNDRFARAVYPCRRDKILGENYESLLDKWWKGGDLKECCKDSIENYIKKIDSPHDPDTLDPLPPSFSCVGKMNNDKEGIFKVRSFPSFDRDGKIRRIVCVLNDVTNLCVVDENFKKVTELNEKILKNIPIGIVTIDRDGTIAYENPYAEKIAGDKRGENIKNMQFMKDFKIVEGFANLIKTGKELFKEECVYFNKSKDINTYLNIRMVPLLNDKKEISGSIVIVSDITDYVSSRIQIENLNENLENKIIERTRQLKEAINLKTRFIADASHELRTPLTIMRGNLDLLLRRFDIDEDSKSMIQTVEDQVDHMAKMLLDLTMLAKGDRDASGINIKKFDFSDLVYEIFKTFIPVAKKNNVDLKFLKSNTNTIMAGDPDKIERMIGNLISNAIKYRKDADGWIKVEIKKNKGSVNLIVSDNGIGISKKDVPYIFERFYRADSARHRGDEEGGTGLGLAICKWVAEIHGGEIRVESQTNKGAKFTVKLPIKY